MATTVLHTIKSSGGDYTSLSAWEAAQQRNLVAADQIAVAECYAFQDTTSLTISGWTADATRYIHIRPTPAAQAQVPYSTSSAYRLEFAGPASTAAVNISVPYTRISNIQVKRTPTDQDASFTYTGIVVGDSNTSTGSIVEGCYILGNFSSWVSGLTVAVGVHGGTDVAGNVYYYNNIIDNFSYPGFSGSRGRGMQVTNHASGNSHVYNNTIVNCGTCLKDGYSDVIARNNLLIPLSGSTMISCSGSFAASSNNAATDTFATGSNSRQSQTFTFVNSESGNYRLSTFDQGALTYGTSSVSGIFTNDFNGITRRGAWDIGAFQNNKFQTTIGSALNMSSSRVGSGTDNTDTDIYTVTPSRTPSANRLLLLGLASTCTPGTYTASSVTGANVTWEKVTESIDADASPKRVSSLWRAVGSSPDSSNIIITYTSQSTSLAWGLTEISNTNISGNNGASSIAQIVARGGSGTSASVTFSPFTSSLNATYVVSSITANALSSNRNGMTENYDAAAGFGADSISISDAFKQEQILTPIVDFAGNEAAAMIGVELIHSKYRTAGGTGTKVFMDNFGRANGTIGSDYEPVSGSVLLLAIISNTVYWNTGSTAAYSNISSIKTSSMQFGPNQTAEVLYTAVAGFDFAGPAVRINPSNKSAYVMEQHGNAESSRIIRYDNGIRTTIGVTDMAAAAGERWKLSVIGSTISAYKNGILMESVIDATHTTGQPGMFYRRENNSSTRMDNFIATEIIGSGSIGSLAVISS